MNKLVFDIGSTNTKFALMTPDGQILERDQLPTKYETAKSYLDTMVQITNRYTGSVDGMAISSNGRMKANGTTYRAYTSRVLKDVDLKAEMEIRCKMPVTVLNDGSAAALGEWWQGAGKGCKNLLVLVLGSGVGAGLILDDILYEGSHLNASAFFNMICGRDAKGDCQFAGMPTSFVALQYRFSAEKGIPFEEVNGKLYFDYVNAKDPVALKLLSEYCSILAEMIYNAAMLLDVERIVVTGGLAQEQKIIQGINDELTFISQDFMNMITQPTMAKTLHDPKDGIVQVTAGELTADANLYGVLYHALQSERRSSVEWTSVWKSIQFDFSALAWKAKQHKQKLTLKSNLNGSKIRVHFNNRQGKEPLVFSSVFLSVMGIAGEEKTQVYLNGNAEILLDSGCEVYSDSISTKLHAGDEIIMETQVDKQTSVAGMTLLFLPLLAHLETYGMIESEEQAAAAKVAEQMPQVGMLYGIDGVEILGEPVKRIAFFGDSITQMGFWSEPLALRFHGKYPGAVTTSNHGIAGNRLLHDSPPAARGAYGKAAVKRFEKDVFEEKKPELVIIQIGVNDLCHPAFLNIPEEIVTAEEMIQGLTDLADIAHKQGTKVVCCTILPFMGFECWDEELEEKRQLVNRWICDNKVFDHYLDITGLLCDESDPRRLDKTSHTGDWLHPNQSGGERIAFGLDLEPFNELLQLRG